MWKKGKSKKLKRLGEFLPNTLKRMGIANQIAQQKAVLLWKKAVGPDIGKQTDANRIEQGVLYVSVTASAWMNELVFLKTQIIKKLNELIEQEVVKDIKFYLK
jgi:predicted nucleic acid-binding Zn ribbon protein